MRALRPFLAAALSLTALSSAYAFGGEDFLALEIANWHHADISKRGALAAQFSNGAAESVCWHADYVDSYGYNPLWWAQGLPSLTRLKAALSAQEELVKVHFDDLVTTQLNGPSIHRGGVLRPGGILKLPDGVKPPAGGVALLRGRERPPRNAVELQMRRYLSGTLDGLIYAAESNDVAMAQHIIGVSLHAIQDFYSHSNWIDEPDRRNATYFDLATNRWDSMANLTLYTGTYETPTQNGVKSHGKYAYACSLMNQPGIRQVLELGCSVYSPIAGDDTCRQFKECTQGKTLQGASALGVTIPSNVIYLAPPGINLDSTWLAEVGARQRGIVAPGFTAQNAFRTAEREAIRASEQWLRRLGLAMDKLGKSAFWQRVTQENTVGSYKSPNATAIAQWENFSKLGYQFVSAGTYPPKAGDKPEQYFLRLKIKTAGDALSGTDADIVAIADGKRFLLDRMPVQGESTYKRVLAYNDFEAGDLDTYLVGPFDRMPTSLRLENKSATVGDVIVAAAEAVVETIVDAVTSVVNGIISFFKTIAGSDPDFVAQNKQVWRWADLPQSVGASKSFTITLNGGDEGRYQVKGTIRMTRDIPGIRDGNAEYTVRITSLHCIQESKFDRLSDSDEPFFAALVNPLTGPSLRHLFGPYDDVDTGETVNINYDFPAVTIPKHSGTITLPVLLMESDDESGSERSQILAKFAGDIDDKASTKKRAFLDTLGAATAADWKVESMEVWAFAKGDQVRSGRVGTFNGIGWIDGGEHKDFTLGAAPPATGIRAQDLEEMSEVNATSVAARGGIPPLVTVLGLAAGLSVGAVGLRRRRRTIQ